MTVPSNLKNDLELFSQWSDNEISFLFDFLNQNLYSGRIMLKVTDLGFNVAIRNDLEFPQQLSEKTQDELAKMIGLLVFYIHVATHDHMDIFTMVEINENSKRRAESHFRSFKNHDLYYNLMFQLTHVSQRLKNIKGTHIQTLLGDKTFKYLELYLTYSTLNNTNEVLRLELTKEELKNLIDELSSYLEGY